METIVNFLRDNWQFISSGFLALLSIILMIIKRHPSSLDDYYAALQEAVFRLPEAIQTAESYPSNKRKDLCISWSFRIMSSLLHRSLTQKEKDNARELIGDQVEAIMTCPTKKGGFGRNG